MAEEKIRKVLDLLEDQDSDVSLTYRFKIYIPS